jgi:hypothetical protein
MSLFTRLFGKMAVLFALFMAGSSRGKHKERRKVLKEQLKQVIKANEIKDVVRLGGAGAAREQLRERARKRVRDLQSDNSKRRRRGRD